MSVVSQACLCLEFTAHIGPRRRPGPRVTGPGRATLSCQLVLGQIRREDM